MQTTTKNDLTEPAVTGYAKTFERTNKMEPAWLTRLANAKVTHCMSEFNANSIARDIRRLEEAASSLLAAVEERDLSFDEQVAANAVVDALSQFRFNPDGHSIGPSNREHYNPQESPPLYPLELDERLHINLWSKCGKHKWTIAMWADNREGSDLRFLGSRPMDPRVSWEHLQEIITQGQQMADARFENGVRA